jgi:rare lipoprotein A
MPPTEKRGPLEAQARAALLGVLVTVWSGCAQESARPPRSPSVVQGASAPGRAQGRSSVSAPSHGHAAVADDALAARYGDAPSLERFSGEASYYGDSLAGHKTASGERYEPAALTAAHRSLPFASIVRVIREDTAQVVYVRITDRGPFVRGRVLDLSRAAAERIDLLARGVARVKAEVVEFGPVTKKKAKKSKRKKRR